MPNPNVLLCLNCCIFPLVVFAAGLGVGRLWGRLRIQSPIKIEGQPVIEANVPRRSRDNIGYGNGQ